MCSGIEQEGAEEQTISNPSMDNSHFGTSEKVMRCLRFLVISPPKPHRPAVR